MKKLVVVMAMALCSVAMTCGREDTEEPAVWRTVEPRLSDGAGWRPCKRVLRGGHAVSEAQCGTTSFPNTPASCITPVRSRDEAVKAVAQHPECIAEAVEVLRSGAERHPEQRSDLAAAYYVQAQVEDNPAYLLNAWDAVQRAGDAPQAHFNRALIQQALGRYRDAERSWDAAQASDPSEWSAEARRNRDRLSQERLLAALEVWPKNRDRLPAALDAGNRTAVASLIEAYPNAAQQYLEEQVIPQWAKSRSSKDFAAVQLLAAEIARIQKDPFTEDVAAVIARSPRAYLDFADARRAERAFNYKATARKYAEATAGLRRGNSPLQWPAELGWIINRYLSREVIPAAAVLNALQKKIPSGRYPHLESRVMATRAYAVNDSGDHLEALELYTAAKEAFLRQPDFDQLVKMQTRISGVYGDMENRERAWREVFESERYVSHVVGFPELHARLGALATAANALGHGELAVQYQSEAIQTMQRELAAVPPEDDDIIQQLKHHLSIALRYRAMVEVELGSYELARRDIEEAGRMAMDEKEKRQAEDLLGRVREVEGRLLLKSDPAGAIGKFSEAIASLPKDQFLHTTLLSLRATANSLAGQPQAAQDDLTEALQRLDREEREQLASRQAGEGEELWSSYFGRFARTYQQLIGLLYHGGSEKEAFRYAERAKAFEPLDLVRRLPVAPRRFVQLTAGNQPVALVDIQQNLPPGTYLLEYSVLEKETIVWIVGHDSFEFMSLPVTHDQVAGWSQELQKVEDERLYGKLERRLFAPYQGLLERPMAVIMRHANGATPRVVIIPDAEMRGLPFPALRNALTNSYLIEDAIVSVHGSATLYVFSLMRDQELPTGRTTALLIGDPHFAKQAGDAYGLDRLAGAEGEVNDIAKLYAPDVVEVQTRDAATTQALREGARRSEVLHLAVHGVVNPREPSQSFLLLAPDGKDAGMPNVQALRRLSLPETRLVVLASCSSAGGAPVGAEGIAPLVRPFVGAGVPAVLGSLWDVDDATARPLLVSFHRRYRDGEDAASALRKAQLEVLNSKQPTRVWAAFQVIGYASPPAAAHATKKEKPP